MFFAGLRPGAEEGMKPEGVEDRIRQLAQPVADGLGLELVDVSFASEHGRRVLRVYIDKPGGITVHDCEQVSREFSTILDVEDPIPQSYNLEVSSPGLDRPLKTERDFARYAGRRAKIKTMEAIDGRRNFKAVIDEVRDGTVLVTDFDGKKFMIAVSNIEKARLEIEI
ncbi:MAG TPA: ribosome maturation factor RimP [Deltaproteobacteria bacterium]|nr:ribosome maturation factor RimP [Deltaproteobacteria bacterium]HCY10290.1 ribosome maturation factor RimP [Deltaproteobacteria bacterium]